MLVSLLFYYKTQGNKIPKDKFFKKVFIVKSSFNFSNKSFFSIQQKITDNIIKRQGLMIEYGLIDLERGKSIYSIFRCLKKRM